MFYVTLKLFCRSYTTTLKDSKISNEYPSKIGPTPDQADINSNSSALYQLSKLYYSASCFFTKHPIYSMKQTIELHWLGVLILTISRLFNSKIADR